MTRRIDHRIEAVARVICQADTLAPAPDARILIGMREAKAWEARIPQARAAWAEVLRLAREPSEAMTKSMEREFLVWRAPWAAGIAALLREIGGGD